jgi:hypothetical protein
MVLCLALVDWVRADVPPAYFSQHNASAGKPGKRCAWAVFLPTAAVGKHVMAARPWHSPPEWSSQAANHTSRI